MRSCLVLRVFTRGDAGGNHLGVVTDPGGLETAGMQQIAAHLGFSETIFVDLDRGVPAVRIFTPAAEMPFAGHPLVGAAWTVQIKLGLDADRLVCQVGEIPIRLEGERIWADTPLVTDVEPAAEGAAIAAEAGLPTTGRTWWARMPIPYLMVEAPDADAVGAADPDFGALLAGPAGDALSLFARDGDEVKTRFFAAGLGVPEDPATGSAASALAAVFSHEGEPEGRVSVSQGEEIGHPSTIELAWAPAAASLGGTVRVDGEIALEM